MRGFFLSYLHGLFPAQKDRELDRKFTSFLRRKPFALSLAISFLSGTAMVLTLPPVNFFLLLFACVPAFILTARNAATRWRAFFVGWAFGCGFFIFGLYWVSAALFVDIEQWKWVLPLSLVLGPSVLAIFYGFIPLLAHRSKENTPAYALIFIAAWSGIEWVRGHILTGFPWNLAGYTWSDLIFMMQFSAYAGIYGLTLLTLLMASLPIFWFNNALRIFVATGLFCAFIAGAARIDQLEYHKNLEVRIVQANIPQSMKWDPEQDWRNIEKHAKMSNASTMKNVSFVVWPETAVTSDLKLFPEIARYISMHLPEGAIGLLGNLRVTYDMNGKENFHNSVTALGAKGKVIDAYDKFHLVPFGEYIPFRDKLNLTPIALAIANIGDFTPGSGNRTLKFDGLPSVSPLICYEAIFPHAAADRNDRPDWLVNVTNDGWYGKTAGPYQHFEIARVRAIEEGLPLVRAANTGISAMIDPYGRVLAQTKLGEERFIDAGLPKALPPTIYSLYGDGIFFAMLAGLGGLGMFYGRRKQ